MKLQNIDDRFVLSLLAKIAKTRKETIGLKRGWYICDQTGVIYAHKDGTWKVGVENSSNGFWAKEIEARAFINCIKKEIN